MQLVMDFTFDDFFDQNGDHGSFEDWLERFQFAIECAAPHLTHENKVK